MKVVHEFIEHPSYINYMKYIILFLYCLLIGQKDKQEQQENSNVPTGKNI